MKNAKIIVYPILIVINYLLLLLFINVTFNMDFRTPHKDLWLIITEHLIPIVNGVTIGYLEKEALDRYLLCTLTGGYQWIPFLLIDYFNKIPHVDKDNSAFIMQIIKLSLLAALVGYATHRIKTEGISKTDNHR